MEDNEKTFKVPLFKDVFSEETGNIIDRIEKIDNVTAPSFCEAIVKAIARNRGFTYDKSKKT